MNTKENVIKHNSVNLLGPVVKAICKYKFHPIIQNKLGKSDAFLFQPVSKFHVEKEIQNIDFKRATTNNSIPPKKLKVNCNTFAEILQNPLNECLILGNFPDNHSSF